MKKTILVFLLISQLVSFKSIAQNWLTTGNALGANGTLGSTTNLSVVFKSNNSERGRLTNAGLWGFGTTAPNSKVHINSASAQVPLRVQVNASTKFLVNSTGGVAIGSGTTPPANGLYVAGNVGIGTSSPESKLHVFKGSAGAVTSFSAAPLSVENSANSYINILAPDVAATGILFGKPESNLSGGIIYNDISYNPNGFDFRTNGNVTKMVLTNTGNVGIGTLTPAYKFSVVDAPVEGVPIALIQNTFGTSSSEGLHIKAGSNTSSGANLIRFKRPDGADIGAIKQASTFQVSYNTASDKRLKNIIGASQKGLADLMKINIYDYTFKSDINKQVQTGFMAQELYEILPQAVSKPINDNESPEKDPWMVDYGRVTPLIIKSVQEQQQIIDELKQSNDDFKRRNENLEERILKLEAALTNITSGNNGNISNEITNISLEQNNPNPFNKNTVIRYNIPQGSKGQINIYDAAGKQIKSIVASESGQAQLSAFSLNAGTYTYSLMVDGQIASSKQMVIVK
jgi:hypothetical protein